MTTLQRRYAEQAQSPWLDNLTRAHLLASVRVNARRLSGR